MALLASEAAEGRTAIATTHDLAAAAEHFTTVVALNQRVIAVGPSSLVLDPDVLSNAFNDIDHPEKQHKLPDPVTISRYGDRIRLQREGHYEFPASGSLRLRNRILT